MRRRGTRRTRPRPGLTMLEVLVALLIATAGFGALMTALSQSKRAETSAAHAERELTVARALLEQAFVGAMPEEGRSRPSTGLVRWTGNTDGLPWTVESHAMVLQAQDLRVRGAEADAAAAALGEAAPSATLLPEEVIRVEVGRVRLSTVRW